MPVGTKIGLGPGDIVLNWDPASTPEKGHSPPPQKKSAHVYCGQRERWPISAAAEHLYCTVVCVYGTGEFITLVCVQRKLVDVICRDLIRKLLVHDRTRRLGNMKVSVCMQL